MFARQSRLLKEELILTIKNGSTANTPLFSLKIVHIPSFPSKFAFVISKKECGSGVFRNKAKRRARAAMREIYKDLKPILCVIFIKKDLLSAGFKEIVTSFKNIFIKKNCFEKNS
ncbi:MAG TPA: ribonuclease P protein component [Candidatus Paceibacterota bacterium]